MRAIAAYCCDTVAKALAARRRAPAHAPALAAGSRAACGKEAMISGYYAIITLEQWFPTSGPWTTSGPQKPKYGPRTILIL